MSTHRRKRTTPSHRPSTRALPHAPNLPPEVLDSFHALGPVMVVNPDGTVGAVNHAALDLLGYATDEVLGQPVGRFFAERKKERKKALARMAHEAPTYAVEATLVTRAGERIPVTLFGSLVLDAQERNLGVVHIARSDPMSATRRLTPEAEANALRTIAEALNRAAGLQEALDRALEAVMPLIGSEAGWIALLEPLGETRPVAARNLPPALEADNRAAMQGTCQCLDLLRQGHLQAATNIVECERLRMAHGDTRGLRHHASVPIRAGGRALGNLNLTTPADRVFTEAELNLLTAVGDQIGVAIDRARLYEQVKAHHIEEQTALLNLSRDFIGLLDTNTILDQTAGTVQEIFRADLVSLMFPDARGENLVLRAGRGWERDLYDVYTVDVAMSREGYAFRNGEAVWLEDVQTSTRFPCPRGLRERGIHSSLTAPLNGDHETLGTLCVHFREQRKFDDHDVRLLSLIANTTAQALERARLFQAEREQRELAEALRDAATALSATLDFDTVLDHLLEQIAPVVPYDTANVMLLDAPTGRVRVARQRGYEQFGEQVARDIAALSFDIAATVNLRRMVESRQPLVIPDTAADPGWVKVEASAHVRSWAGAPIVVEGQVIAFFSLDKVEPNFYRPQHGERLAAFAGQAALALQNARLFEETGRRVQELALLYDAGLTLNRVIEPRMQLEFLLKLAATALRADAAEFFVFDSTRDELRYEFGIGLSAEAAEGLRRLRFAAADENTVPGWVATNRLLLNLPDAPADPRWVAVTDDPAFHSALFVPVAYEKQLRGILGVKSKSGDAFTPQDERLLTLFANQVSVAMNNARLFAAVRESEARFAGILDIAAEAIISIDETQRINLFNKGAQQIFGYLADEVIGQSLDLLLPKQFAAVHRRHVADFAASAANARRMGERREIFGRRKTGEEFPAEASISKLEVGGERIFTVVLRDITERVRAEEEVRRRAGELEALAEVSAALRQAQTREAMLPLLVEKAMQVLQANAGALILREADALVFAAARGPAEVMLGWRHPLGDDPLWQVARTGEPMFIPDVTERSEFTQWEVCRALMAGMTACACVPLKTAEATVGLLHLACRSRRETTPGEIRLLTSIAEMAGNALHRATLHEQTERDAVELALAYDATIEGWARALELRDRETEGHTRRVTEMAERLARAMSMSEAELIHLRRGALLHDMGKMGVPDGILLKSGPLADEEWMVMRLHPQLAYDMLSPIAYLRPALDIPYCHHEKWDGMGYPRGLKGEQIPFAARIFAVVDVWDALRSDRPYRKGWPETQVREYIREQAGKHFDPRVVEVFLELDIPHA